MSLVREMPVKVAAILLSEDGTRIRRILDHSDVQRLGMDETSSKRGQDCVTFFFDMDQRRLFFGTEGKNHKAVKVLAVYFQEKKLIPAGEAQLMPDSCTMHGSAGTFYRG